MSLVLFCRFISPYYSRVFSIMLFHLVVSSVFSDHVIFFCYVISSYYFVALFNCFIIHFIVFIFIALLSVFFLSVLLLSVISQIIFPGLFRCVTSHIVSVLLPCNFVKFFSPISSCHFPCQFEVILLVLFRSCYSGEIFFFTFFAGSFIELLGH